MKKTIKGWCKQYDINWYGQGIFGPIQYDWKLVLASGKSAIFSSIVKSDIPELHKSQKSKIFVFPNVNSKKNNGKISEERFIRIIRLVNEFLDAYSDNESDL